MHVHDQYRRAQSRSAKQKSKEKSSSLTHPPLCLLPTSTGGGWTCRCELRPQPLLHHQHQYVGHARIDEPPWCLPISISYVWLWQ